MQQRNFQVFENVCVYILEIVDKHWLSAHLSWDGPTTVGAAWWVDVPSDESKCELLILPNWSETVAVHPQRSRADPGLTCLPERSPHGLNYTEIGVAEDLLEASRSFLCLRMFGSISESRPLRWKEKWPPCCTVNLLLSFYFSFFSLAVWERCLGKDQEAECFQGAGVSGTEQHRTKSWHLRPGTLIKHAPHFFE